MKAENNRIVIHPVEGLYMKCDICERLVLMDDAIIFCLVALNMMGQLGIGYRFYCANCLDPETGQYIY